MTTPRTSGLVLGSAIALLIAVSGASAQQDARAFLRQRHDSVVALLGRSAANASAQDRRNADLDRILRDLLDFDELSRSSLRDHWEGLKEPQRAEFRGLFATLVERSYRKNLESILDYEISYSGESQSPNGVVVHTVARSRKNRRAPEIAIDYALRKAEGNWKVFDVTTDGISLVDNYRNQFNRIIARKGWDELLGKMRARLESGSGTL